LAFPITLFTANDHDEKLDPGVANASGLTPVFRAVKDMGK
jgi:hypothetical protein